MRNVRDIIGFPHEGTFNYVAETKDGATRLMFAMRLFGVSVSAPTHLGLFGFLNGWLGIASRFTATLRRR